MKFFQKLEWIIRELVVQPQNIQQWRIRSLMFLLFVSFDSLIYLYLVCYTILEHCSWYYKSNWFSCSWYYKSNSTSVMLETALAYRATFSLLQEHDSAYTAGLSEEEWEWMNSVTGYLKLFVEITNAITSNKFPTSNIYFPEICDVHVQLIDWCKSSENES